MDGLDHSQTQTHTHSSNMKKITDVNMENKKSAGYSN